MDKAYDAMDVQKSESFSNDKHLIKDNEKFQVLFDKQELCDVTLISADDEYRVMAHKKVLTSTSKYFHAMFDGSLSESEADEVKLSQFEGRALKSILIFIYKGQIELTIDTADSVFVGAHILELSALEKICCNYMKKNLNVSKCLGISELAKLHDNVELHKTALLFVYEHFVALSDEYEFLSLSCGQLCELISKDELRMPSEADVFRGIMAWVNYAKDDRKLHLTKLLSYLRFPLLSPKFISEIIEKVGESAEMLRIVYNALIWHTFPNVNSTIYSPEQRRVRNFDDVIVAVSGCEDSSTDLSVGLYYSGLKEWIYTKWPAIPSPRKNLKFIMLNKKLIIGNGKDGDNFSNRVDCFNLETLQWEDFPDLDDSPLNAFIKSNRTVYGFGDNFVRGIAEPFKQWYKNEYADLNPLREKDIITIYKDEIIFPYGEQFKTFNIANGTYNLRINEKPSASGPFGIAKPQHSDAVKAMHTMRNKGSDYLVVIMSDVVRVYNLSTYKCVIRNKSSFERDDRTAVHNNKIIICRRNDFYEYDVFKNNIHALPKLLNGNLKVDILLTNNRNGIF